MRAALVCVLTLVAAPASGEFVDLELEAGSGDKLLTWDTVAGLEWLKVEAVEEPSGLNVPAELAELGFRLATVGEVCDLYERVASLSACPGTLFGTATDSEIAEAAEEIARVLGSGGFGAFIDDAGFGGLAAWSASLVVVFIGGGYPTTPILVRSSPFIPMDLAPGSGDRLVTRDTELQLDWFNTTPILYLESRQVAPAIEELGLDLSVWRLATLDEVCSLIGRFAPSAECPGWTQFIEPQVPLAPILGRIPGYHSFYVMIDDGDDSNGFGELVFDDLGFAYATFFDVYLDPVGPIPLLVRPVAEPSAFAISAAALGALALIGRRRTQD